MLATTRIVTVNLPVADALVDAPIYTVEQGAEYEVVEALHSHAVAGTNGGAVTLALRKADAGAVPSAGTAITLTTWDLKSTVNTPVTKTSANGGLSSSKSTRTLRAGQSLVMDFTGTLTALAGFNLTVVLRQTRKAVR